MFSQNTYLELLYSVVEDGVGMCTHVCARTCQGTVSAVLPKTHCLELAG